MSLIAFLGCDGAGKSAVIAGLAARLGEQGRPVALGHWRPRPLQREATEEEIAAAADPHARSPRSLPASVLKLGWIWLNWWLAWVTGLRRRCRDGHVLYDRYHADLAIDPRRYRYGGPVWLARLASRTMPQPDLVLFLDAPVDVLLSRKQEVPGAVLEESRRKYLELCASGARFRVVDATRSLEEVISAAEREVQQVTQPPS